MSENKKKKRPLDVKAIINSAVFFGFIVIFGILTLVMPKEKKSELENRNLADFPKFSFDNVMNCKFMNGIETYISDHFVGRVPYLKLKGASERFIGRSERNDVYITGERMMLKVTDPDYASVDKSIDAINIFNDGIDAQVYMMLVPTSAAIYSDQLPKNAPNLDQQSFIDYVYGKLDSDIVGIALVVKVAVATVLKVAVVHPYICRAGNCEVVVAVNVVSSGTLEAEVSQNDVLARR